MKSIRSLSLVILFLPAARAWGDGEITYNKHVAPILWKHCAECHRPGQVGPFSLLTYKDAARRAKFIQEVTARREMPPWKPEPGHGDFHDERRLSDAELKTLAEWARTGAREGDPRDLPPAPAFPKKDEWRLGQPDLVLKMSRPFAVPATGPDMYRCFVIPTGVTEGKFVSAVEFRPGNTRVVHHALFFLDHRGQARRMEKEGPGAGYAVFGGLGGVIPTGDLGTWTPGQKPRFLPEQVGMYMPKGSDLVMQIHYHPTGKAETDQSTLAVYFSKKQTGVKGIMSFPLVNFNLRIPAGAARHRMAAQFTLPVNADLVAVQPHMHNLGKEIRIAAVFPGGERKSLIWIKDWSFNWQDRYLYKEFIRLPKGTRLECEAFYDNSAANPLNPHQPPKEVRWGEGTTEEMLLCGMYVTMDRREDYRRLFWSIAAIPGLIQNWYFETGGNSVRTPPARGQDTKKVADFKLTDLKGRPWSLYGQAGKKAVVIAYLSTECPLSNNYAPVLAELARRYEPQGAAFVAINANPDETAAAIARHAKEFKIPFTVLPDPRQESVAALRPKVNPEVFVLDGNFRVRYRGGIDDLYAERLKKKAQATREDLRIALEEVLAGKNVSVPVTEAVGCPLTEVGKTGAR
jgi:thiol-disulfide isomerase/thioredoxin